MIWASFIEHVNQYPIGDHLERQNKEPFDTVWWHKDGKMCRVAKGQNLYSYWQEKQCKPWLQFPHEGNPSAYRVNLISDTFLANLQGNKSSKTSQNWETFDGGTQSSEVRQSDSLS